MDFLTNLVITGKFLLVIGLVTIMAIICVVIGHEIGDKYNQSYLGGMIGLVFWAWILVSFITSNEFLTWVGLI